MIRIERRGCEARGARRRAVGFGLSPRPSFPLALDLFETVGDTVFECFFVLIGDSIAFCVFRSRPLHFPRVFGRRKRRGADPEEPQASARRGEPVSNAPLTPPALGTPVPAAPLRGAEPEAGGGGRVYWGVCIPRPKTASRSRRADAPGKPLRAPPPCARGALSLLIF